MAGSVNQGRASPSGRSTTPPVQPNGPGARSAMLRLREALAVELEMTRAALVDIRRLRSDRLDDDEHDPEGTPLSAEWSRLEGLRRAAQQRISDVDVAIANLDAGRYGTCLRCGQPISPGRLEAQPTAVRCVRCAGRRF
jgi:DnaK suppressor protein